MKCSICCNYDIFKFNNEIVIIHYISISLLLSFSKYLLIYAEQLKRDNIFIMYNSDIGLWSNDDPH